ncbi:MAG: endo-1,4-beta-xylanase [Acidobacteriota bacterium]|nr:MAG: endo-1,4-beta-xylanase [Acidobacteriota bacterium]
MGRIPGAILIVLLWTIMGVRAERIVYPQAAVGPIGGQTFDLELRLGNLDPNQTWQGEVKMLRQSDLSGTSGLQVRSNGQAVEAEQGAWAVTIPPSGSVTYQVTSASLEIGVMVIESDSSALGNLVPSFFYRLGSTQSVQDLIAVQPERKPVLAFNSMISQKTGFGSGLALVSEEALASPQGDPIPETEVSLQVITGDGQEYSVVITLGGSEAAQKAVFPAQLIPGLPKTFEAARLLATASKPIYATLLAVGSPPLFEDVQIGATPVQPQSNSRFSLEPGWQFAESGQDLLTNAFWGCSSSAIREATGGFWCQAIDGFQTVYNQTGPYLRVNRDFGVLGALHASLQSNGSISIVGRFPAGPEWWRGLRRIDLGIESGQVFVQIFNNRSTPKSYAYLEPGTLSGLTELGILRRGTAFIILANGEELGEIPDEGIFVDNVAYLGSNVGPGNTLTVYGYAAVVPVGRDGNVEVVFPAYSEQVEPVENSLRALAQLRGINLGSAASPGSVDGERTYRRILGQEFNMLTPENETKWSTIHPSPGTYNFCPADTLMAFAGANGMKVRVHVLVWHSQNPSWLDEGTFSREELIEILREHITRVAGRYRGRIAEWDVVNEAFEENGTFRKTLWFEGIGPEYIELAFQWAHAAAPDAKLYYNDYNIAARNPKSDAVYALVQDLQQKGIPIDGVGLQAHVGVQPWLRPVKSSVVSNIARFNALGLSAIFTELDVRINLPTDADKLEVQATVYRELLEACLESENCPSFVIWGFTDRYSWVPTTFPGYGDALLFDADYQPKPAYEALLSALAVP